MVLFSAEAFGVKQLISQCKSSHNRCVLYMASCMLRYHVKLQYFNTVNQFIKRRYATYRGTINGIIIFIHILIMYFSKFCCFDEISSSCFSANSHAFIPCDCNLFMLSSVCLTTRDLNMLTSSNGNIFRVTGHLCREFTGHRWIPRTKASDAELWCFLWSASE